MTDEMRDVIVDTTGGVGGPLTPWRLSWRADPRARPLADRHYNRQKKGARQFVPPGRCVVLLAEDAGALWVTSWPFAEYVQHAWAGAWINSTFRNERPRTDDDPGGYVSSDLIREAVAATAGVWDVWESYRGLTYLWPAPPAVGLVTFVDPNEVPGVMRRGLMLYGYCYLKAGFTHVGFTQGGLWAWQLLPADMPQPAAPLGQLALALGVA